jgi:hypothetical protein
MTAIRHLQSSLLALFYAAPWGWLVCLAVFTAGVWHEVGHFPYFSHPDPKRVEASLGLLFDITVYWFGLTLLSPLAVGGSVIVRASRGAALGLERNRLVAYAIGVSLFAYVILGDPWGLSSWYFD